MSLFDLTVNGEARRVDVAPVARLLDVLRHELGLTGTKEGCGEGECGACAVILDGELVTSCLVPVADAAGGRITTIEGIASNGEPSRLQRCFVDLGGAQCGICTPGMIMAATHLAAWNPHPTLDEVKEGLAGNLCRCTGYQRIFEAVLKATERDAG